MSRRTILVPVVAVLTTAGAVMAGASAGATAGPSRALVAHTVPKCSGGPGVGLTARTPFFLTPVVSWLNTTGNGFAGGIGYELQFTNISNHECWLSGFPGVSAVTIGGHVIGAPATHNGAAGGIVDVSAGATARASWLVTDTGNLPSSTCKPTTAGGIRVTAPGSKASEVIPFPFSVCSSSSVSSMSVRTVTH